MRRLALLLAVLLLVFAVSSTAVLWVVTSRADAARARHASCVAALDDHAAVYDVIRGAFTRKDYDPANTKRIHADLAAHEAGCRG